MHTLYVAFMIFVAFITGNFVERSAGQYDIMSFDGGDHWVIDDGVNLKDANPAIVVYVVALDLIKKSANGHVLTDDEKKLINDVFPGGLIK